MRPQDQQARRWPPFGRLSSRGAALTVRSAARGLLRTTRSPRRPSNQWRASCRRQRAAPPDQEEIESPSEDGSDDDEQREGEERPEDVMSRAVSLPTCLNRVRPSIDQALVDADRDLDRGKQHRHDSRRCAPPLVDAPSSDRPDHDERLTCDEQEEHRSRRNIGVSDGGKQNHEEEDDEPPARGAARRSVAADPQLRARREVPPDSGGSRRPRGAPVRNAAPRAATAVTNNSEHHAGRRR